MRFLLLALIWTVIMASAAVSVWLECRSRAAPPTPPETIFLARLRDWDNSLSGGLPDDMRAELDRLLDRAGVRRLRKGDL